MCGIVGILELDGSTLPSRHVLESMAAAIAHRGPDEHGIWVDGCVGLAARRLRVVDLERASSRWRTRTAPCGWSRTARSTTPASCATTCGEGDTSSRRGRTPR